MDFDFVEVHRVKEFSFRPVSRVDSENDELCTASHSSMAADYERNLNITRNRTKPQRQLQHSVWNVDGEIIDEPAVHVRYVVNYNLEQFRINHMGEVAHATGPSLLGAPRFSEAWL
jgi:hypothetical protein